jgi:hypothetical protein
MVLSLLRDRKDPQAMRDGLAGLKEYPGISGATTFAGSNDAQNGLFLIKVQDGKFTLATGEK